MEALIDWLIIRTTIPTPVGVGNYPTKVNPTMYMTIGLEAAINGIGSKRLKLLRKCHEVGWERYEGAIRPVLPLCESGAQATIVHECVIEEVRRRFAGVEGVIIHDRDLGPRFLVEMDRRMILQFKKLTRDFLTVNNPTDTSEAFDRQEFVDGFPNLPRLTVGYQFGQYGTSMGGIWLAFIKGKEPVWYYDLRTGEQSTGLDFSVPTGPSPADLDFVAARRARRLAEGRQREDQSG